MNNPMMANNNPDLRVAIKGSQKSQRIEESYMTDNSFESMMLGEEEETKERNIRPYDYQQRYRLEQDYRDNRATPGVTVSDLKLAFSTLPALMSAVAQSIQGIPDRDYALSVISPFHAASKGARIPNL